MPDNTICPIGLVLIKCTPAAACTTPRIRSTTLYDLSSMILAGERFIVRDAETGTDVTRDIYWLHSNEDSTPDDGELP